MINVSALAAFKSIENDGVRDGKPSSERVSLKDVHQYLIAEDGFDASDSLVEALSNSLWACILTSGSLARFRVMGLNAADSVDVNGIICHYCFQRLNAPLNHQQAMEEVHKESMLLAGSAKEGRRVENASALGPIEEGAFEPPKECVFQSTGDGALECKEEGAPESTWDGALECADDGWS